MTGGAGIEHPCRGQLGGRIEHPRDDQANRQIAFALRRAPRQQGSEIDASGTSLLPLLAGFNIGVEIAQLGIVSLVLPLIYLARGTRWYAAGVMPFGSCALGAAGIVWMWQRIH